MKRGRPALEALLKLQQSKDPEVQYGAVCVLWELEGKTARDVSITGSIRVSVEKRHYSFDVATQF